ncbi:MBL fold metallo-hydrolase [Pimelobacter simplex]|uniref:MBL fold metallo-hydrolase n=1 Tax=Nocardioides simplex TaxID=2045 RepID=UPI001931EB99|nr:MBL fold metallo-hydrolase [Pimelobacter simplex]
MGDPLVSVIADAGLGNSAYLLDLGDGRALAVDASRDLRSLRIAARARGLQVAYAADTHLHADFLSGAVQLAASDGAQVLASRAGGREFSHRGLEDGEEVDLGGLTLRAICTPGHTDEHLAFLLLDGSREIGVFSGGSLIAGSAARVDLVAPERTEELARAQYRSLHRLAVLDPATALWPTHGGGSFCSTAAAPVGTVTTIGDELAANELLRAPDEDTFARLLLGSLGSHPPYFHRLGEANRRGPDVLTNDPVLEPLLPEAVRDLVTAGAEVVDVRPLAAFARAHPARALSIPLRTAFASWLGWLAPHDRPLVVLREQGQDAGEVLWQALKIGYDNIVGEIAGGIDAWAAAGLPTAAIDLVSPADVSGVRVLDIRQEGEYASGHLPGAAHLELGDVAEHATAYADGPVVVMCGHGERAMSAASLLARAGAADVRVLDGGPDDVAGALDLELDQGP